MNREEELKPATQPSGLLGGMVQRQMNQIAISRADLNAFLTSSTPREIPSTMQRQLLGDTGFMLWFGPILAIFGLISGLVFFFLAPAGIHWLGLSGAVLMPALGIGVSIFVKKFRAKKLRILQDGAICQAHVTGVGKNGNVVNEREQFDVKLDFEHQLRTHTATYQCEKHAADQARGFKESNQPTNLLIDPEDAQHVICLDLLVIAKD